MKVIDALILSLQTRPDEWSFEYEVFDAYDPQFDVITTKLIHTLVNKTRKIVITLKFLEPWSSYKEYIFTGIKYSPKFFERIKLRRAIRKLEALKKITTHANDDITKILGNPLDGLKI
jgi:hypothetical protein